MIKQQNLWWLEQSQKALHKELVISHYQNNNLVRANGTGFTKLASTKSLQWKWQAVNKTISFMKENLTSTLSHPIANFQLVRVNTTAWQTYLEHSQGRLKLSLFRSSSLCKRKQLTTTQVARHPNLLVKAFKWIRKIKKMKVSLVSLSLIYIFVFNIEPEEDQPKPQTLRI